MQWERKNQSAADKLRSAGLIILAVGVLMLALGIALTFFVLTILSPILLSGSILVNTAAVICLRQSKQRRKGEGH